MTMDQLREQFGDTSTNFNNARRKPANVDYEGDVDQSEVFETPTKKRSKSTSSKYSERLRASCYEYAEE